MQKYTNGKEVRYFEDDVDVKEWINLDEYRLMTDEEVKAFEAEKPVILPPLKRRQFMRVLVLNGIDLDQIESLINSIEDTKTRQLALIDWKDATEFWRNDETLLMLADMLKLTPEKIDELWIQALEL